MLRFARLLVDPDNGESGGAPSSSKSGERKSPRGEIRPLMLLALELALGLQKYILQIKLLYVKCKLEMGKLNKKFIRINSPLIVLIFYNIL